MSVSEYDGLRCPKSGRDDELKIEVKTVAQAHRRAREAMGCRKRLGITNAINCTSRTLW
jgi:hypothetical protein